MRRLFFQKPQDAYTEAHNVQILVRSYFMHAPMQTHGTCAWDYGYRIYTTSTW